MGNKQITLYALSTCSHCRAVKLLLGEYNIEYNLIEVDKINGKEKRDAMAAIREYNPGMTFPTLVIDGNVIVGHREREILEALGL